MAMVPQNNPIRSPKKKKGNVKASLNSPTPDNFLPTQSQYLPWLYKDDMKNFNKQATKDNLNQPFPESIAGSANPGDIIYMIYEFVTDDNKSEETCFLAKILHKSQGCVRIHLTDTSLLSKMEPETIFHDDILPSDPIYIVKTAIQQECEKKHAADLEELKNYRKKEQQEKQSKEQKNQNDEEKKNDHNNNQKDNQKDEQLKELTRAMKEIKVDTQAIKGQLFDLNMQHKLQPKHVPPQSAWNAGPPAQLPPPEEKLLEKKPQDPKTQLVIANIPYKHDENLALIMRKIAEQKQIYLRDSDFKVFRALSKSKPENNNNPPNIICQFVDEQTKTNLKKRSEKNITLKDLGLVDNEDEDKTIYLNDNLPHETRRLYYATRQYKKDNKFKHAWTHQGFIYLRENDDSARLQIQTLGDLERIKDPNYRNEEEEKKKEEEKKQQQQHEQQRQQRLLQLHNEQQVQQQQHQQRQLEQNQIQSAHAQKKQQQHQESQRLLHITNQYYHQLQAQRQNNYHAPAPYHPPQQPIHPQRPLPQQPPQPIALYYPQPPPQLQQLLPQQPPPAPSYLPQQQQPPPAPPSLLQHNRYSSD
jgi:hypothetical protein